MSSTIRHPIHRLTHNWWWEIYKLTSVQNFQMTNHQPSSHQLSRKRCLAPQRSTWYCLAMSSLASSLNLYQSRWSRSPPRQVQMMLPLQPLPLSSLQHPWSNQNWISQNRSSKAHHRGNRYLGCWPILGSRGFFKEVKILYRVAWMNKGKIMASKGPQGVNLESLRIGSMHAYDCRRPRR